MAFRGLEGVRGLMCLWVIVSHTVTMVGIQVYKGTGAGKLLANGGIAVDVFVILSGFVICLILSKKKEVDNSINDSSVHFAPVSLWTIIGRTANTNKQAGLYDT